MNKPNNSLSWITCSYCSPTCETLEVKTEGVLCYSSTTENFTKGDPVGSDDYNQIF